MSTPPPPWQPGPPPHDPWHQGQGPWQHGPGSYGQTPATIVPYRPLELGDVLSGAFRILKARWGLFIAITLLPLAVGLIAMVLVALLFGAALLPVLRAGGSVTVAQPNPLLLGTAIVAAFVAYFAFIFVSVKSYAMTIVAARAVDNRQQVGLGDAWAGTRGVVRRALVLVLLVVLVTLGVSAVFVLLAWATVDSQSSGAAGASILLMLALIPLMFFLAVRWVFYVHALTLDNESAIGSLRRSWALTRGSFWRVFGYMLVLSIIINIVTTAVTVLPQTWLQNAMNQTTATSDPTAMLTAVMPALVVLIVLQSITALLLAPYQNIFWTVMYTDLARRKPHIPRQWS